MSKYTDIVRELSDDELIELVNETVKYPIPYDSPLRDLAVKLYGRDMDDTIHMLTLIPQELMYVLAERLVASSPHVTERLDINKK
jgi:hypothetical protein